MLELIFLQDMAVVMAISAVIIILFQRFHLPVVVGYILAGVVIGPHTPPFPLVKDLHSIHTLSELGVIFLLFSIGLEFNLTRLVRVGLVSFFAAVLEIVLMIWIGFSLGRVFGWNFMDSFFLGAILSISSTTIIAKVLTEMKKIKEKFAQVILGILIIEDLLAIVIIALLSGVASTGSLELQEVGIAMIRVISFVGGVLVFGFLIVPRLLKYIARFENAEMVVITVLGLCFGISLLAAKFGFSVALGAFLIGAVIAETKQVEDIIHKMDPIRDMFTAIFFVSVGMLLDPQTVVRFWQPILVITFITIIGKVLSCSLGTFLTGYKSETALKVGLGLAQIGEFSFIIARLGESAQVTGPFLYPIAVSVSGITALTTPFLIRNTGPIIRFLNWVTPRPVATVFNLYTGWVERMGGVRSERKAIIWKELKIHLPRLFFYAASALVLFYGVSRFQERLQIFPTNVYWIILGIAMFPLFMGFAYTLDRILWNILFLNLIKSRDEIDQDRDVNQIFHNALRFFMVLLVGLTFLAVGSSFLPRLPLAVAVIGLIFVSGIFLWGSMRKVHERIEKIILGIFDQEKPGEQATAQAAHEELVKLIHEEYPWEVVTEDFLLPYQESAVNQTIGDLRLRSETGATIVAIYRGEESTPNPPPETKLFPGDVLLLMGDKEQVRSAILFLNQKIKEVPPAPNDKVAIPRTQKYEMVSGSEFIGRTLKEIKLRRKTGATLLGIQKGETTINNPGGDTIIESLDTLILFGRAEELESAVRYLSSR